MRSRLKLHSFYAVAVNNWRQAQRRFGWGYGGSGITKELWIWIVDNVEEGSTVVELGAGFVSTRLLSQRYDLVSVEQNEQYLNQYPARYIFAPIDRDSNWYTIRRSDLPATYSLLIIDGPSGEGNRAGILSRPELIDPDALIIVDDTWRETEKILATKLADALGAVIEDHGHFCVLRPRLIRV